MIKKTLFIALSLLTAWSLSAQTYYGEQDILFQFDGYSSGSISAYDFDGDGDTDFLLALPSNDTLAWYENTDGNGTLGEPHIISDTANSSIKGCDIDGDGDLDVLAASSNVLAWYENTDGEGTFGEPQIIPGFAGKVYTCDIDGDGDQDVLTAGDSELAWNENTDGEGTFGEPQVIPGFVGTVYFCDIDGDGDQDVLKDGGSELAWNENTDGKGTFGEEHLIAMPYSRAIIPCDIDGDGDQDILLATGGFSISGLDDYISWYENTDGNGTFTKQPNIINYTTFSVGNIYVCDVDGDGDQDVLSTRTGHYGGNGLWDGSYQIAWYENTDGNGTFGATHFIIDGWKESSNPICAISVRTYDIDGDGDQDVLSGTSFNDTIAWYINTDGHGTFDGEQVIVGSTNFPRSARVCDINGDGDPDVLSVSSLSEARIAWYENITVDILTQPTNDTICPGSDAEFSLTANGAEMYQWQVDEGVGFTDLSDNSVYAGVTTHTLTVSNAYAAMNGYIYRCMLNPAGTIFSDEAVLTCDTISPEITSIHDDILIDADSNCEVILPDYTGEVTATDNCDMELNVTQDPTAGTIISGQTNTITLTVTDDMGNMDEVTFNMAVEDITNPTIICVSNQTVMADETHYYAVGGTEFDLAETSDNCGLASIENDFNNTATLTGAQIPEGTTTITWTIADYAGNENICSFDINVTAYIVGIEELQQKGISIYPNPTTGKVYFEFANTSVQRLTIFDITGNQILEKTPIQQNGSIDLSCYESGIYMIRIHTDEEILIIKMMKE